MLTYTVTLKLFNVCFLENNYLIPDVILIFVDSAKILIWSVKCSSVTWSGRTPKFVIIWHRVILVKTSTSFYVSYTHSRVVTNSPWNWQLKIICNNLLLLFFWKEFSWWSVTILILFLTVIVSMTSAYVYISLVIICFVIFWYLTTLPNI